MRGACKALRAYVMREETELLVTLSKMYIAKAQLDAAITLHLGYYLSRRS